MNKKYVRRKIIASSEVKKLLMERLGCSQPMCSRAFNYEKDTPVARAIRLEALRLGAEEMVVLPIAEAWQDLGKEMRQYHPNGKEIVISKEENVISVWKNDFCVWSKDNACLSDIKTAQQIVIL